MGRRTKSRVIVPTISDKEIDALHLAIGEKVKAKRKELESSIEDFAYQVNISRSGLIRVEMGKDTTIRTLLKVLRGLNTTPEDFFRSVQSKKEK